MVWASHKHELHEKVAHVGDHVLLVSHALIEYLMRVVMFVMMSLSSSHGREVSSVRCGFEGRLRIPPVA